MTRTNPTNLRSSMVVSDYAFLREAPIDDDHAVRLRDLKAAQYNYLFNGIPLDILFPGVSHELANDKTAIYVGSNGLPITAKNQEDTSTGIIGIRNSVFCFLNNMIIKGWSSGMTPGTEFFLGQDGTLTSAPVTDNTWSIRLAIAINPTDILTSFHISGKSGE